MAGCLGGIDGGDDDVFRIGHLAPTRSQMGLGAERSIEIAVDEANDDGGILDQEVELLSENTEGQVDEGTAVVESLVQEDDVDLLIGTFVSEVTQGVLDFVADRNVPFIITGSADPETITEFHGRDYEQYRNVFRTGPINSDLQAEAMGQYAEFLSEEHGWEEFAILADDAAWTGPFMDRLPDEIEDRGFDVVHTDTMGIETDDFTQYLDDVDSADADAVFRFIAHADSAAFISTWQSNEYPFAVEGINVPGMSPAFWDATEGACLYETTSQSGAGGVAELTDRTMPFVEEYEDRYADDDPPSKPMYMGFNSYDAVHFYREAIESAGTADYESDLDDIVDAMLETEHTGAAGEMVLYGEDSEYPNDLRETRDEDDFISNFPMTQWQEGGEVECVFPESDATADHVAPEWL
ncbi:ABC transporter substrate-binding protein [Natronococcus sp.]|uniref:ABC transporter substrate-binding protein n=1 Tax=Natronococcus sp. TaxID=35747 RepID=UPI003A4E1707